MQEVLTEIKIYQRAYTEMKLLCQGFPRPCSILGMGSRFKIDSPKSEVMKIISAHGIDEIMIKN